MFRCRAEGYGVSNGEGCFFLVHLVPATKRGYVNILIPPRDTTFPLLLLLELFLCYFHTSFGILFLHVVDRHLPRHQILSISLILQQLSLVVFFSPFFLDPFLHISSVIHWLSRKRKKNLRNLFCFFLPYRITLSRVS